MVDSLAGVGRVLALDVGLRRIGLALSDPLGITAQGLQTFFRTNLREDLARLSLLAREHETTLIVVGLPMHMSGNEGRQAGLVRDFAEKLEERSGLPVRMWDERLTTMEATRILKQSGVSQQKRSKAVDRLSAVLILQSFLDAGAQAWPGGENA